ncbi:hypothetical protein DL96DRAFT_1590442 [Flagelloscypha sp. PMI_526]|nr:hypothetical protein DL96DRAFT_1590442 [Flagelloscypha sp. PMI_526]
MYSFLESLAPELICEILFHCDKATLLTIAQVSPLLHLVACQEIYANVVICNRKCVQRVLAGSTKHLGRVRNIAFKHHGLQPGDLRSLFNLLSSCASNVREMRFTVAQVGRLEAHPGQVWDETQAVLSDFQSLGSVSRITAQVYNGLPRGATSAYRGALRTLRLDTIPIPFSSLEDAFDVSDLRRLALWSDYGESTEETMEVLRRVYTSLEILSIFQSTLVFHHDPTILYPHLKTLLLWTSKGRSTSFPWTTWVLPTVHIFVHLPPFNRTNRKENASLKAEIRDASLREFSINLSRLKSIRNLNFRFWEAQSSSIDDQLAIEDYFRDLFSYWDEQGRLQLDFNVNWTEIWPFLDSEAHLMVEGDITSLKRFGVRYA